MKLKNSFDPAHKRKWNQKGISRQNATRTTNGKKPYIVNLFMLFSARFLYIDALEKMYAAENIVS